MTDGLPIRRNMVLLATAMAVNSASLQLVAALAALTFVLVTGIEVLLGLGPAIYLGSAALGALVSGRMMDRRGRVPVLAGGFFLQAVGTMLIVVGLRADSSFAVVAGFALSGIAAGTTQLIRTAAGDMHPPERRGRGIAWVLFGAVFGAILGPAVYSPILAGRELDAEALTLPWLAAGALALVGMAVVLAVRPDPKRIAELIQAHPEDEPLPAAAPLRELVRRPGAIPAMVAGVTSFAVMVSVMNLAGYVVVEHRHHAEHFVFPIIGAHVLGMYLLVPVVGTLIDRIGRTPALAGGLVLVSASCAGLAVFDGLAAIGVLLFGLGLGWNVSFVAATAALADATLPGERGRLIGANDLLAAGTGALLVLLGGYVLDEVGVYALAAGMAAIALLPVLPVLIRGRPVARPVGETL
ncbi:MAG: MFS transporter [Actinomycetota bacterium]|nr:MFS transporter [Actinomycetota bacterium]